ncbi:PREDICTED: torsin-like protein [Rhagoletis zephyria]|uniref:torsin-like protein n=1 Tax=Rhagoletis zephyria TaxID=28612 RepID=UPI00081151F7|nr:PREDICTED: torsin-like protein [Rhagoletis zephyria]
MKCTRITVLLLLLLSCCQLYVRDVEAIGITVTVAGIAAALGGGYFSKDIILCYLECCNDRKSNQWINFQPSFEEIEQKLFGQHIAVQLVKRSIRQHLKNENPPKALVLSFHGYTGVGKNYLASLIAKAIYRQNSGGEAINAQTNLLRAQGVSRDKIPLTSYDSILNSKAIREGGLKNAELISRGIIDLFVPFLPLERENVKKCIEVYLRDHRNYTTPLIKPGSEFIEKVADQLTYIPDTDVYSRFGCKRVAVTVDIMINDD